MYSSIGTLSVDRNFVRVNVDKGLGEYYRRETSRHLFGRVLHPPMHGYHITIANFEKRDRINGNGFIKMLEAKGRDIYFEYDGVIRENEEYDGSGVYYFLEVNSPLFSIMRQTLGLKPRLHPFHLTVGYYQIKDIPKKHSHAAIQRKEMRRKQKRGHANPL